jgi:hypothetical protein
MPFWDRSLTPSQKRHAEIDFYSLLPPSQWGFVRFCMALFGGAGWSALLRFLWLQYEAYPLASMFLHLWLEWTARIFGYSSAIVVFRVILRWPTRDEETLSRIDIRPSLWDTWKARFALLGWAAKWFLVCFFLSVIIAFVLAFFSPPR